MAYYHISVRKRFDEAVIKVLLDPETESIADYHELRDAFKILIGLTHASVGNEVVRTAMESALREF